MGDRILQSEATAALRTVSVRAIDGAGVPVTGLVALSPVIKVAKQGGNFASAAGTLTEVTGGAEGGGYRYEFTSGEVDTVGELHLEITKSGVIQGIYAAYSVAPALRAVDLASDCITAAKIATDAIDGDAIAATAVSDIQAGLPAAVWALAVGSARTAGSIGDALQFLLAVSRGNSMIDQVSYGGVGLLTSARLRAWDNATDAGAASPGSGNGADGEDFRATITAVDAGGGTFSSFKLVRTL